jgi:hypothetical protein
MHYSASCPKFNPARSSIRKEAADWEGLPNGVLQSGVEPGGEGFAAKSYNNRNFRPKTGLYFPLFEVS